nr:hypothetical protein UFVOUMOW_UFVOUMOW_CDS_0009 [Microvirus sp.]
MKKKKICYTIYNSSNYSLTLLPTVLYCGGIFL